MRITKHKGRLRKRTDWSQLDDAISKLKDGQHLRVYHGRDESTKKLAQRVRQRYQGVEVHVTQTYVVVQLNGGDD